MITVTEYSGKKIAVFGLGKAGEATIAGLRKGGATVYAWDDKLDAKKEHSHPLQAQLSHFSTWPWNELQAVVLSPGVPYTHPAPHAVVAMAKDRRCPVIGDIDVLYNACPKARYVGITGTNGKSTTTTLIGHILKTCNLKTEIGGNLGTAALSLNPLGADGVYVLELSSYQLDLIQQARMNVAVWLNITPDHLDRHGDMTGYVRAKLRIFAEQTPEDVAIIAVDDEFSRGAAEAVMRSKKPRVVMVSAGSNLQHGIYVIDGMLHDDAEGFTCDLKPILSLTGRHNWQNAAAAYAAARALGLAPHQIYAAMKTFPGLKHRLQLVASYRNVRFINDSKATNADATANALAPYDSIYWILGGKPKAGGIETLSEYFPKIAHAFLIGEAEDAFAMTLEGKVPYTRCGDLKRAVNAASSMALNGGKPDAVVLLSPACASFDQWKNFEERGDAFCDMVAAIVAKGGADAA